MNRYVKFGIAALLWVLIFVVWMRSPWMLLGVAVIFDLYITGYLDRYVFSRHRGLRARSGAYRAVAEWVETVVFAVVVATLIHTCVFQMYVIPTPSMEKTLLVGDYLYVSKLSYGPRMPNTPLSVPLVHNMMPLTGGKSYSTAIRRPYKRLAGLKKVERDDVVVFNWPDDDLSRPVDKRENYVKRCVALPGDSLEVRGTRVYVNGVAQREIAGRQQRYYVVTDAPFSSMTLRELGVAKDDYWYNPPTGEYFVDLTEADAARVRTMGNVALVQQYEQGPDAGIFPGAGAGNGSVFGWTNNDFGPIWVPARGATVQLTVENLSLYERIIDVYEGNELEVRDGEIFVNGVPVKEYTFKMDYYWMMGDNRQNSLDSRYWGFVPEDHIVGKASFVWLSLDKDRSWFDGKIRWRKMFKKIR